MVVARSLPTNSVACGNFDCWAVAANTRLDPPESSRMMNSNLTLPLRCQSCPLPGVLSHPNACSVRMTDRVASAAARLTRLPGAKSAIAPHGVPRYAVAASNVSSQEGLRECTMVESCDEAMGWAGGWAVGSSQEGGVIVVSGFCS